MEAEIPHHLRFLQNVLETCAKRWLIADRYRVIIRAAVAELQNPIVMCSLPTQFYDLRYSTLDIHETMFAWVDTVFPDDSQIVPLRHTEDTSLTVAT